MWTSLNCKAWQAIHNILLKKANYCWMSDLPFLSKLTEKTAKGQLLAHLNKANVLDLAQSWFMPGQGTDTAFVALIVNRVTVNSTPLIMRYCSLTWVKWQESRVMHYSGLSPSWWDQQVVMGNCTYTTRLFCLWGSYKDQFSLWTFSISTCKH